MIHGDDDHRAAHGAVCFQFYSLRAQGTGHREESKGGRRAQTASLRTLETEKLTVGANYLMGKTQGPCPSEIDPIKPVGPCRALSVLLSTAVDQGACYDGPTYRHLICPSYIPRLACCPLPCSLRRTLDLSPQIENSLTP